MSRLHKQQYLYQLLTWNEGYSTKNYPEGRNIPTAHFDFCWPKAFQFQVGLGLRVILKVKDQVERECEVELPSQGQIEGNIKWNYPLMMT